MSEEKQENQESIRDSMLAVLQEGQDTESTPPESEVKVETKTEEQAADTGADSKTSAADTEEPGEAAVIPAPEHWSEDHKIIFDGLTDEAKTAVMDIEKNLQSGFTQKTEDLAQQRKRLQGITDVIDTYHVNSPGVSKEDFTAGIAQLMPTLFSGYSNLNKDPLNTLMQLAKTYNVEEKLSDSLAGIDFSDPNRDLQKENEQLKTQLKNVQTGVTTQANTEGAKVIREFSEAKTDDGALRHPDFESVKPVMGSLMAADPSLSMEDAYSKAIWSGPNRDKLLEGEFEKRDKKKQDEKDQKIGKARRNQSQKPTAGKASGAATTQKDEVPTDIGDALRQTLAEMEESQE